MRELQQPWEVAADHVLDLEALLDVEDVRHAEVLGPGPPASVGIEVLSCFIQRIVRQYLAE